MAPRRWDIFRRTPVHEATQRAWCRLLFVLAGALPVLITFLACCAESIPAYQRARVARYAQLLSQTTGLSVQIDRVELLTPSQRWLKGVRLHHPETGVPLGQMEGLWISETPFGCAIHAQKAELVAEQLADCYRLVHEQVLCRPALSSHATVVSMNDLVISSQTEAPVAFSMLHMELKRQVSATAGSMRFRLIEMPGQEGVLTFDRHHDQTEPISHWTLNNSSQALPGSWINRFASDYSIPGAHAAFSGTFDLTYNQAFWSLRGAGRMHRVDASTWFERPLLSGTAYADVTRFSLNEQGLNEAAGKLLIQDGRIHGDLFAAAQHINITAVDTDENIIKQSRGNGLPFRVIEAGFQLDGKGLQIIPRDPESNVVAWDQVSPIAKLGPWGLIPNLNLAWALSRAPATENERTTTASRLVQWLPKPRDEASPNYQVRSRE